MVWGHRRNKNNSLRTKLTIYPVSSSTSNGVAFSRYYRPLYHLAWKYPHLVKHNASHLSFPLKTQVLLHFLFGPIVLVWVFWQVSCCYYYLVLFPSTISYRKTTRTVLPLTTTTYDEIRLRLLSFKSFISFFSSFSRRDIGQHLSEVHIEHHTLPT